MVHVVRTASEKSEQSICSRAFYRPLVPPPTCSGGLAWISNMAAERLTEVVEVDLAPLPLAEGITPLKLRARRRRGSGNGL